MTYDWKLGAYRDNGGNVMNWDDAVNALHGYAFGSANDSYDSRSGGSDIVSFISALGDSGGGDDGRLSPWMNNYLEKLNDNSLSIFQQKGKEVTLKSLNITDKDTLETRIFKILKGMKVGDYASGDLFSFVNSKTEDYIKTVTRVDMKNFKITTKGLTTGLAIKNNSILSISKTNITELRILDVYKITLHGLTSIGKSQIYQNVWINNNTKYFYENEEWIKSKFK